MVSNQAVTQAVKAAFRPAGGLAVLALVAGCQLFPHKDANPEAEAPPAAIVTPRAETAAEPETAIEAALARSTDETVSTTPVAPQPVVMNPNAPLSYTVKRGDTLWDISAMYLRDPWLWPEIWHVNPAVQNPHLIYPGDVLTLAYGANGEPQVMLTRGNALRVQPLVRSTSLDGPIATIPYEAIAAFLGKPSIVSKEDLKNAPRVAALRDNHVLGGAGHEIYVKGLKDLGPGRYAVVHVGDELKDPETGKVLGYMGTYTAAARVDAVADVSKAMLIESARETTAGDLLYVEDLQAASTDIVPRSPPPGTKGQIMAVVDGVSLIGQYQVVAVNRGSRDGLEKGHVLAIDQKGEVIPDGSCRTSPMNRCGNKKLQLPDERAGTLLVFKTYDRMSYGLVVNTIVPVKIADVVRTP